MDLAKTEIRFHRNVLRIQNKKEAKIINFKVFWLTRLNYNFFKIIEVIFLKKHSNDN
jgi:hypothetical protein